jgi:TniQ
MIPAPYLDESFGSWWRRAALTYRTREADLAETVLALDHEREPRGSIDWDTGPPETLLISLAGHTRLRIGELQHLIVARGPATLRPAQRDAYCPRCFAEDKQRDGISYIRRSWLDAWQFSCERHACLLGTLCPYEYEPEAPIFSPVWVKSREPPRLATPVRLNPSVKSFAPLPLKCSETLSHQDAQSDSWWDPAMMQSMVGRDLMLFMGSSAADLLFHRLFGIARPWNAVWHDQRRRSMRLPQIEHPMAPVAVRLEAAYLASLVWRCLQSQRAAPTENLAALLVLLREELQGWHAEQFRITQCRWTREDRRRWNEAFG